MHLNVLTGWGLFSFWTWAAYQLVAWISSRALFLQFISLSRSLSPSLSFPVSPFSLGPAQQNILSHAQRKNTNYTQKNRLLQETLQHNFSFSLSIGFLSLHTHTHTLFRALSLFLFKYHSFETKQRLHLLWLLLLLYVLMFSSLVSRWKSGPEEAAAFPSFAGKQLKKEKTEQLGDVARKLKQPTATKKSSLLLLLLLHTLLQQNRYTTHRSIRLCGLLCVCVVRV